MDWKQLILERTEATDVERGESIQSLWSGFGEIFRVHLQPAELGSLVVKHIAPGAVGSHPRGWGTDLSTKRKLRSYEVESYWYGNWGPLLKELGKQNERKCRIPTCFGVAQDGEERWILLEDLDAVGFRKRHGRLNAQTAIPCVHWLANFHGRFLGHAPDGLWPVGTYWHLDTRPDEYAVMSEGPLKKFAGQLDAMLSNCEYQTIVHGDAKVANFCFSDTGEAVAAVDFQYVGGGCGMKDVAYFFGSCFDESQCERWVPQLLDEYFAQLRIAVSDNSIDLDRLESQWRELFAPAWTDFHRFLSGWAATHAKIHRYTQQLTDETLAKLM